MAAPASLISRAGPRSPPATKANPPALDTAAASAVLRAGIEVGTAMLESPIGLILRRNAGGASEETTYHRSKLLRQ